MKTLGQVIAEPPSGGPDPEGGRRPSLAWSRPEGSEGRDTAANCGRARRLGHAQRRSGRDVATRTPQSARIASDASRMANDFAVVCFAARGDLQKR